MSGTEAPHDLQGPGDLMSQAYLGDQTDVVPGLRTERCNTQNPNSADPGGCSLSQL